MNILYDNNGHKNVMFNDLAVGEMIQSTQHLIIDGDEAILLDPGGHKVYATLITEISKAVQSLSKIKYLFFSHQDPDIIASANAWLMMTDAKAYLPEIWIRFITHFGVDDIVLKQITPIQDSGTVISLNGKKLEVIPAHFLHSTGNFQIYDQESKILYSGDMGASFGQEYDFVESFEDHIQYIEGFHKRYIANNEVLKKWVSMIKKYDIETIAPQHGAVIKGKENIEKYFSWLETLKCGIDLMDDNFQFKK
ncbi:MAG: MBL fold metallo-hydrolase [Acidobacteriota bacterium]